MATKQKKIINKINSVCGQDSKHIHDLRKNPNDEFYTSMNDIMTELCHWGPKLRGKNIICPCDCDIFNDDETDELYKNVYSFKITFNENSKPSVTSKTWEEFEPSAIEWPDEIEKFIKNDVEINGVNTKEGDVLFGSSSIYKKNSITEYSKIKEIMSKKVVCNFIKSLYSLGCDYGISSITASGYDVSTGRGIKFQDVDYSKYDMVITNPPFSLYPEFMKILISEKDSREGTDRPFDFIVLAPFLNRANPSVGLPLMLKKCYLGYGRHTHMNFQNPDKNGMKSKGVSVDWITTFSDAQDEIDSIDYKTGVVYETYKDDYKVMDKIIMKDGTKPIKVGSGTVPDDYDGWMFGPINILDKLNQSKYEWYLFKAIKYFNTDHPEENPCSGKLSCDMLDGSFPGILFRKKEVIINE